MQQYRLFTLLSSAYALHFTGLDLRKAYEEHSQKMQNQEFDTLAGLIPILFPSELELEMHATSAGLKAVSTALAADGIEECRKCCGGILSSKYPGVVLHVQAMAILSFLE